ncbi:hypothetical protein M413DRAFT_438065 [Hebeloma cylindrosporum]|uniref:Uncharacterized protein n=1 Tax=Hebeloma cylindrosporum TaxID=76867 RepID=A0A0C3CYG9_HEBCY|nr:hypothetical protein M413DRAFT_438065 [Hebeloma cylindrosporum h7]
MSWSQWGGPILCLAAALSVLGQISDVKTCVASFNWTINSMGQTPCLVAAFLESQCGIPTAVNAIPPGTHYLGPNSAQQNPCICSSVTYSMVSACGACQGLTYVNWTTWSRSCLGVELTTYPKRIPQQTEVPIWAYLNVTLTNGGFDPATAQQALIANTTAVPSIAPSSSTSQASASANDLFTTAPIPSSSLSASNSSDGKGHSNAGAIAGGVVGGLVFLAIRRNAIQKNLVFDSSALVSGPAVSHTTGSSHPHYGSSPTPLISQSSYGNQNASYYQGSQVTSGVYTHRPQSQGSMESISESLLQLGQRDRHQQSSQPFGFGRAPEI